MSLNHLRTLTDIQSLTPKYKAVFTRYASKKVCAVKAKISACFFFVVMESDKSLRDSSEIPM